MIQLLEVNLTSWDDRWMLAGISVLTVFVILIILVFVLQIFSIIAEKANTSAPKQGKSTANAAITPNAANDDIQAAIATAIYLYQNDCHDEESGILTIKQTGTSWGKVLNPRL